MPKAGPRFEPAGLKKARSVTHKLRRALEKAPGLQEDDLVTSRAISVECTRRVDSEWALPAQERNLAILVHD